MKNNQKMLVILAYLFTLSAIKQMYYEILLEEKEVILTCSKFEFRIL